MVSAAQPLAGLYNFSWRGWDYVPGAGSHRLMSQVASSMVSVAHPMSAVYSVQGGTMSLVAGSHKMMSQVALVHGVSRPPLAGLYYFSLLGWDYVPGRRRVTS